MVKNKKLIAYLILLSQFSNLFACTGIFLKTKNNSYIYGRTLEFGFELDTKILFIPRNYKVKPYGLSWKSKYAAIGANAFDSENFVDGVNEKGLAGGLFYFPGYASYQKIGSSDYKKSVPIWQLLTWILTNFSNINEIKKELPKIKVSGIKFPGADIPGLTEAPPLHLIIHDSTGKSIVIEYIKGKLFIHDNPIGIITNSPSFDWHMTNLNNYINLSPINVKAKTVNGVEITGFGQGTGMLGIPGDFTPPSRFIRAFVYAQTAIKSKDASSGVFQAFHILNNFDIPKGVIQDPNGVDDYTTWTSVIDMKNKIFYIRPHDNFQLQKISLMQLDLNSKKPLVFSIKMEEEIVEIKNIIPQV